MKCCPTCGAFSRPDLPFFMEDNVVVSKISDLRVHLSGQEATIFKTVYERYPRTVPFTSVILFLYEQRDEPTNAENIVRVCISRTNDLLAPFGWYLVSEKATGVRLSEGTRRVRKNMSQETKLQIYEARRAGVSVQELCKKYGLHHRDLYAKISQGKQIYDRRADIAERQEALRARLGKDDIRL